MLKTESTLTNKYQTTIPSLVRQTLGLEKGSKIIYQIQADGSVTISCNEDCKHNSDPILSKFLNFLAQDMEKNPQHIQPISLETFSGVQSLVADISVDLDAPLTDEEE